MNIRHLIGTILLVLVAIVLFLLVTRTIARLFAFAGDYAVDQVLSSVVLLRNTRTTSQEEAFLLPTGGPVANGDYKLVLSCTTVSTICGKVGIPTAKRF